MLKAKSLMPLAALAGAGLLASACTTTGNVERNAAGGAALGALAGAVIGNNVGGGDAGTGAAIGAALGGGAGAVRGCRQDGGCGAQNQNRRQYYDSAWAGITITTTARAVITGKTAARANRGRAT